MGPQLNLLGLRGQTAPVFASGSLAGELLPWGFLGLRNGVPTHLYAEGMTGLVNCAWRVI